MSLRSTNKPLLVGELNPYGADQRYALYPSPRRSAGGRLCYDVLGLLPMEYFRTYDRANLCTGKWSTPAAGSKAFDLEVQGYDRLILLGAKVSKAFSVPFLPFTVQDGKLVLPHPSGLCRLWNEPGAYERAREAVRGYLAVDENPTTTAGSGIHLAPESGER